MKYVISAPTGAIQDTIYIPSSKSISNRMLIIRSLAGSFAELINLSDSDDTRLLMKALQEPSSTMDVGHAGTAMRFLAAYLTTQPREVLLTGSERMKQRPIGPLVKALRQLGARIDYTETEGCPPLRISGKDISGGEIQIEGGISSQFISALMMIGPVLKGGIAINLTGELVSTTYIEMTRKLMNQCGVDVSMEGRRLSVPQQSYSMKRFTVESDWSGASYWYQVASLLPGSKIVLPHLTAESLQGDSIVEELFKPLGVESDFGPEGVTLCSQKAKLPAFFEFDFTGCPDLVQTFAVTLCALGVSFRFSGTQTLRIKETDRIAALQEELRKVGYLLESAEDGRWISWDGSRCQPQANPVIGTYHDHRMAMSFAPLAITRGTITIENPGVVSKSYPGFWQDLEQAGFRSPSCTLSSENPCGPERTA